MLQPYFYIWSGVVGFLALIIGLSFSAIIKSGSFGILVLLVLISAVIILGLKIVLTNRSNPKKVKFGNSRTILSNKDLLNILRNEGN